jgi:hypothetical protein
MKTQTTTTNNLQDILFDVQKVTMEEATNGLLVGGTSETEYAIVGKINKKNHILNSCSERYNLVPNSAIFSPIEKELKARGIDFDVTYKNVNNVKFYGDFVMNSDFLNVGTDNDIISPKINIAHSYNGLLNYSLTMGYFRLVCSNGLVIPVKGQEQHNFQAKGKHTPSLDQNLAMMLEKMDYLITNKELVQEGFNSLYNTKVTNLDNFLLESMEAIGMNAENKRSGKKTKNFDYAKEIAQKEAKKLDSDMNLWLVYNAVNNTIFNDDLNTKHDEFRTADDTKLMSHLLELV